MIKIVKNSNRYSYLVNNYQLDDEEELQELPTFGISPGSEAYVLETGRTYILSNEFEWALKSNPGEGGGSDIDLTNYATKSYVQEKINDIEIPEEQDLTDYALKSEIPDISNLATKSEVTGAINGIVIPDVSNFITADDIPEANSKKNAYDIIKKIEDYLYFTEYSQIDYDYAEDYFNVNPVDNLGGCSSVRNGNFYGRNLDWIYNEDAAFVVRTNKSDNRFASIGVAFGIPGLTNEIVESGDYKEIYKLVPFRTVDGVNENGVFCNVNVYPKVTDGHYIPENPIRKLNSEMIPRFVLDNFSNAGDAINALQNIEIQESPRLLEQGYECHFMIGDNNNTYVVEFVEENDLTVLRYEPADKMTNFMLHGVNFNDGTGKVFTPADKTNDAANDPITVNNIQSHGAGLERYNYIVDNYNNANTKAGMRSLMNGLFFTQAYNPSNLSDWASEFCGDNLTISNTLNDFVNDEFINYIYDNYSLISRDSSSPYYGTWQTEHSSVYDLGKKRLYIVAQENNKEFVFDLADYSNDAIDNKFYTKAEIDALLADYVRKDAE